MEDEEATIRRFQKELNAGTISLVLLSVMERATEPMPDGSSKVRIADTTVNGESTGIFDVSVMVGYLPGSILITNNQGTPASMSVLINPDATLLPVVPIPALGEWGMLALILLLAGAGSVAVLRNREGLA